MRKSYLSALLSLALLTVAANATPISYIVSDTATGTLGKSDFTNQLLTITLSSDTASLTGGGGFFTNPGTATLMLGGATVATFTDSVYFFVNQSFTPAAAAGIGDANNGGSVLDTLNSVFSTYTGATAIGPVSGTSFFRSDLSYGTTAGLLNIASAGGTSTFTAVTPSAVPEPSTLALLTTGLLGAAGSLRRKLSRS